MSERIPNGTEFLDDEKLLLHVLFNGTKEAVSAIIGSREVKTGVAMLGSVANLLPHRTESSTEDHDLTIAV